MKLFTVIKRLLLSFMEELTLAWWAEITTISPRCIYYFGPFQTALAAKTAYPGYIEDLNKEGAQGIIVVIKRCQPDQLTIGEE